MTGGHIVSDNTITIAVFSKDEDRTVGAVIDGILAHYTPQQVVLVVTGATDRINDIVRDKQVCMMQDNGRGKGAAIRAVIERSHSGILVFIDADGSHEPNDIGLLAAPLLENRADMVIASRFKGGSEEFSGSLDNYLHLWGNYLSAFVIKLFWGKSGNGLLDCQNGFRAIKADIAKKLCLRENGFAIEQEMVIQGLKNGLRIIDVPSFEYKRKFGQSHINYTSSLLAYVWSIVRNIFK